MNVGELGARFGIVRYTDLPFIARRGTVRDLDLQGDEGIMEPIHMRFFPGGYVVADFNFFGPRLSRFTEYMLARVGGADIGEPRRVIRGDTLQQLEALERLSLLTIAAVPSELDALRVRRESLHQAFEGARGAAGNEHVVVELTLKAEARGSFLGRDAKTLAKSLLGKPTLRDRVQKLIARGPVELTGKYETLNLLEDRYVFTREFKPSAPRGRGMDTEFAYQVLGEVYEEIKDDLDA
jgi:hypothetical protein